MKVLHNHVATHTNSMTSLFLCRYYIFEEFLTWFLSILFICINVNSKYVISILHVNWSLSSCIIMYSYINMFFSLVLHCTLYCCVNMYVYTTMHHTLFTNSDGVDLVVVRMLMSKYLKTNVIGWAYFGLCRFLFCFLIHERNNLC